MECTCTCQQGDQGSKGLISAVEVDRLRATTHLPADGTENDDHNPPRIAPRHLFDFSVGTDNLLRGEGRKVTLDSTFLTLPIRKRFTTFNQPSAERTLYRHAACRVRSGSHSKVIKSLLFPAWSDWDSADTRAIKRVISCALRCQWNLRVSPCARQCRVCKSYGQEL
jgi:hypothetical protein